MLSKCLQLESKDIKKKLEKKPDILIKKNCSKTINTDEFDQIFQKYTTQNTMFREFYSFLKERTHCYRNACNLNLRISKKKIEKKPDILIKN